MADNKFHIPTWCIMILLHGVALTQAYSALAQVQTDVVFLIDGSGSVEDCPFAFEKEAISTLICGGDCASCSDLYMPHDGSIAVSVIQFAGTIPDDPSTPENDPLARVHVPLTILDSSEVAGTQCAAIQSIPKFGSGGSTPLVAGLELARQVFEQDGHEGAERLVVILSDIMEIAFGDLATPAATAQTQSTLTAGPCSRIGRNPTNPNNLVI